MSSFSKLLAEINSCTICAEHLEHPPRPVIQADPAARILIAGQAPGRRVQETGIPFDDPSGNRLRDWMGLTREQFYDPRLVAIIPMGFCYPGKGKSGDLPPRPECAPAWLEKVLSQLKNIELTLLLGQYAQAYHLPEAKGQTLTATVKEWQAYWPDRLPLPHPSPRNIRWFKANPWFQAEVIPELQNRIGGLK